MTLSETKDFEIFTTEIKFAVGYFACERDKYVISSSYIVLFYENRVVAIYNRKLDTTKHLDLMKVKEMNLALEIALFKKVVKYL